MKRIFKILSLSMALLTLLTACERDPFDDVVSHERAIEAITLQGDLVQVGPAEIDRVNSIAYVNVLMEEGTDLSQVKMRIMPSYKAKTDLAEGTALDFGANDNKQKVTVIAESGDRREWTIELVPFVEPVLGTFAIKALVLYGGTGPEYGGGGVIDFTDKPWVWPNEGGPEAEYDNTLTFTFTGVTEDGKTYGTIVNDAGADGKYANFLFVSPETDVNHLYRTIPAGTGIWEHDYTNNTIIFKFEDGRTATAKLKAASTIDLGNGYQKTITDEAFEFTVSGTDDWDNIYSDYDKFVKRPRFFWIDVQRQ